MAFVVRYRRSQRALLGFDTFETRDEAFDALGRFESDYRNDEDVEVVLLTASSEEDLRRTHGRFFGEPEFATA